MERTVVDSILAKMQKPASQTTRLESVRSSIPVNKKKLTPEDLEDDEDDEEYIPVGIGGLMAASEKLLAVNRGIDKPDERDSLIFKRFMTTDRLLAERIDMDADRTRMKIMPAIAKQLSL
jgi:DNA-directed RNA polymerase beta subunit